MWFFRIFRAIPFFLFLFVIAGCGFTPLLAPSYDETVVPALLASIKVDRIPNRSGQELRNFLLERFSNENNTPFHYRLAVQLDIIHQQVGIQKDATTKRMRLVVTVFYQLYDIKTGKQLTQKIFKTYSSFNFVDQAFYSNTISRKAGVTAALRTIADMIKLEIAQFLQEGTPSSEPERTPH